jgi:site-specific recombinase XerD
MSKELVDPTPTKRLTTEGLLQLVIDDQARHLRKDRERLPWRISVIKTHLDGLYADQIDENTIDSYIAARMKDVTRKGTPPQSGTINRELSIIKRALRLAYRKKYLPRVPYIAKLAGENVRTGFIDKSDIGKLLDHLPSYLRNPIEYAAFTSWRLRSDVLTRKWSHVSFETSRIRIDPMESKNNEAREIPFIGPMERILRDQRAKADLIESQTDTKVEYVFFYEDTARTQRPGKMIRNPKAAWDKATTAAGLPGLLIHDLRRSGVRNMMMSGMDKQLAMLISGHKTPSMFDRYRIVDAQTLKEQGDRYGSWYNGAIDQPSLGHDERQELEQLRKIVEMLRAIPTHKSPQ